METQLTAEPVAQSAGSSKPFEIFGAAGPDCVCAAAVAQSINSAQCVPVCGADRGNPAYYTKFLAAGCVPDESEPDPKENTAAGYIVNVGDVVIHDDVAVPSCVDFFNLAGVEGSGGYTSPGSMHPQAGSAQVLPSMNSRIS